MAIPRASLVPSVLCLSAALGAALFVPLTELALRESPLCDPVRAMTLVPPVERAGPADEERLRERIQDVLDLTDTPGAAVALVRDGRVSWTAGFGFADLESKRPATPETLFRVGSISKSFVALAVLQLVEAGHVRLDQTVKELAPEIRIDNPWESTHPVRLVHLLEHTAGFDDWHLCDYAHQDPTPISLERGLAYNPRSRKVRWPPGTHFSYSNGGPPVAARIVEKITGESYESYVGRNLFAPLDIPHASFLLTDGVRERLASGYRRDRLAAVDYWHLLQRPSGALNASVTDLGHLVEMLSGEGTFRGRQILRPESVRRMLSPESSQAARAGLRFGYGLGSMATLVRGRPVHGHDGGLQGFLSSYAFRPSARAGYAVVVNRGGPALGKIDALLRQELGRIEARPPRARLTRDEIAKLAGTYRYATPRASLMKFLLRLATVRIATDGETLYLVQGKDRIELIPAGNNLFRIEGIADPVLAFVPGPGGSMDLETGYLTFRRCSPWGVRLESFVLDLFGWLLIPALSAAIRVFFTALFKKSEAGPLAWLVPLLPVLAGTCLLVWWIPFFSSGEELIQRYGRVTFWSMLLCLMSWGFAAFTLASIVLLGRTWEASAALEGWWPSTLATGYLLVLLLYFLAHGLVGLMTWWY